MDNGLQNFIINTLNEDFSMSELARDSGFLENLYPPLDFENELLPVENTNPQNKKEKKRKKTETK
jgi:hypothetical protein